MSAPNEVFNTWEITKYYFRHIVVLVLFLLKGEGNCIPLSGFFQILLLWEISLASDEGENYWVKVPHYCQYLKDRWRSWEVINLRSSFNETYLLSKCIQRTICSHMDLWVVIEFWVDVTRVELKLCLMCLELFLLEFYSAVDTCVMLSMHK